MNILLHGTSAENESRIAELTSRIADFDRANEKLEADKIAVQARLATLNSQISKTPYLLAANAKLADNRLRLERQQLEPQVGTISSQQSVIVNERVALASQLQFLLDTEEQRAAAATLQDTKAQVIEQADQFVSQGKGQGLLWGVALASVVGWFVLKPKSKKAAS